MRETVLLETCMSQFFGVEFDQYLLLLYQRWCSILMQSYHAQQVCLLSDVNGIVPDESANIVQVQTAMVHSCAGDRVVAKPSQLPFREGGFDMVISIHAHERDVQGVAALAEMSRIVSPGGHLVCFSVAPWSPFGWQVRMDQVAHFKPHTVLNKQTMKREMSALDMHLVQVVGLLYRLQCAPNLFNRLAFLEVLGPFLVPFYAAQHH